MVKFLRLILTSLFLLATTISYAGAPYINDDPDPAPWHAIDVIFSAEVFNNPKENILAMPSLEIDYGLLPKLEFNVSFPYVWNYTQPHYPRAPYKFGDLQLSLKYEFWHSKDDDVRFAFAPIYTIPTGNPKNGKGSGNGTPITMLPILFAKQFGPYLATGGAGYGFNNGSGEQSFVYGGALVQRSITEALALGAELFYHGTEGLQVKQYVLLNVGAVYSLNQTALLLFSMGHSIWGQSQLTGFLGMQFNFMH